MRRPTRTRRLSIAAVVSLLAFGVVMGVGVRGLWAEGDWLFGYSHWISTQHGCILYTHDSSGNPYMPADGQSTLKPSVKIWRRSNSHGNQIVVIVPFVYPLLLLLIIPVLWLMARSENTPAFPVVTKHP